MESRVLDMCRHCRCGGFDVMGAHRRQIPLQNSRAQFDLKEIIFGNEEEFRRAGSMDELRRAWSIYNLPDFVQIEDPQSITWARDLVRFVMHFPQLEVLGLTFDTCLEAQHLKVLHEAIHLDRLRALEIASVYAGEEELAHLLISLGPILNRVLLRTIRFPTRGSWISFVRSIRDKLSVTYINLTNCNVNDTHFLSLRGHPKIIFQEGRENLHNLVENMVLKSMVLPDLLNHHLIL